MTTRERIKREIDHLSEQDLAFLHRIIQALTPAAPTPMQENAQGEEWADFLQETYGVFQSDSLERAPQGMLETREALE